MLSDSIINASIPNAAKDIGKKKRANRSAKLKQCKLDARREQWLSQVKNKVCKEETIVIAPGSGGGGGEFNGRTHDKSVPQYKDLEVQRPSVEENHLDSDLELSPAYSPTSIVLCGNDLGSTFGVSSSSSSSNSSFNGRGCCSGSITEEEEGGDDGLDDWEAMADALAAAATDDKQGHDLGPDLSIEKGNGFESDSAVLLTNHGNVDASMRKLDSEGAGILGKGVANGKAWRVDDAFRPQSLPNLAKHQSFPANCEKLSCHGIKPWIRNNVPTSCPICCEDLDLTDSSFLPCSCGFRLCLFCHKRILEDDARCPGCRRPYASDPLQKETSVSGGSLTIKLTHSSSMFSRV